MSKRICVITGSRAEYGLLKPLMHAIRQDCGFTLQLIVTGMHLSAAFGLTYKEIEQDGFVIDRKIKILSDRDTPEDVCNAIGMTISALSRVFKQLRPQLIVILGDRFEALAASVAAHVSGIAIAHLSGGEITEGSMDNAFRFAITKMSQLHFVALEQYRKRVIQLGEQPRSVFTVGALGLDNIAGMRLLSRSELEHQLGFSFSRRNLLITFHPLTLEKGASAAQFKILIKALDSLNDTFLIFTKANADPEGRSINRMIDRYVAKRRMKARAFTSLGQLRYLSMLQFVDAVVGNSSSGIIEAPSFKIATVNIGDRQRGRVRAQSVIDCEPTYAHIIRAIRTVYSPRFKRVVRNTVNRYGDGNAAKRILAVLKCYDYSRGLKKKFYDIGFTQLPARLRHD